MAGDTGTSSRSTVVTRRFLLGRVVALTAGLAAAGLLAACGGAAAPTAAPTGAAPTSPAGQGVGPAPATKDYVSKAPVSISFGSASNPDLESWTNGPFKQRNPNITVTYAPILGTTEEQRTKILTMVAAKTLPNILYVQGTRSQLYIINNVYQDLDPWIQSDAKFQAHGGLADFYPQGIKPYQYKGKTFCLPYDFGPACLMYYKPLFDQYNVPYPNTDWSWEVEFREAAVKLSKPGQTWMVATLPTGGGQSGWPFEAVYLRPWGGRLTNDDETKMLINTPESIAALTYWKDLLDKKATVSIAEASQFDANPFFSLKVGTWWDGAWAQDTVNHGNPAMVGKWDVTFMPKGPKIRATAAMGSGYGICTSVANSDESWIFLREFTDEGMEEYFAKRQRSAHARKSRADLALKLPNSPEHVKLWIDANDHAFMGQPISPIGPELGDIVARELQLMFLGKKSVKEATDTIASDGEKLVAKNRG